MRCHMLILAAAASLLTPMPAGAREPRQPTGQWTVDFHESQCVAYRNYGTSAEPFILALKAPPLGELMELVFIRPGYARAMAEEYDVSIGIGAQPRFRTRMLHYAVRDKGQRLSRITLRPDALKSLASAGTLSVSGGSISESFALSRVDSLLKIMEDCVIDLRKVWNVASGDGAPPALRSGAIGSLQGLIKHTDYPAVAIQEMKQGSVQVAVLINEQGKIADCTLIETSGTPVLDTQTCAILKARAKFQPAVGLDGKPAKHAALQRVTWRVE